MGKRFVNATGEVEKIRLATESKRDFSFDVSDLVCIKIEIFFLLCMSHILDVYKRQHLPVMIWGVTVQ